MNEINENTLLERRPIVKGQPESEKESVEWKHVTLGGISGILMGAGLVYAGKAIAASKQEVAASESDDDVSVANTSGTSLPVAQIHNDQSFGDAFAAARAEVGPGGVFIWHGGIYNTYTAEEWNAMTLEQKTDFANQVNPEYRAHDISTPTDTNTHVIVEHHVYHHDPEAYQASSSTIGGEMVNQKVAESYESLESDDVHIVGYANHNGHLMVGYDVTGDGQADVAIIDVGQPGLSGDDIITDGREAITYDELNEEPELNQTASMDNPDVAPDMPDYMNDANVNDINGIA